MGNKLSNCQPWVVRESQHVLFDKLRNDEIDHIQFCAQMLICYGDMNMSRHDKLFLGYNTLIRNGHIRNKEDAMSQKYEFTLEGYLLCRVK